MTAETPAVGRLPGGGSVEFQDTVVLAAPRTAVWAFLLNPHELGSCLPGLEKVEIVEPDRVFGGVATLNVAGGSFRLPARVEWVERDAMRSGRLRALTEVAGHPIEGNGVVELDDTAEGGTQLSWTAGIVVPEALDGNPMLLQIVQNVARQFITSFFTCIQARLEVV